MLYLVINHRFGLLVRILLEKFGQIFCNPRAKKHANRCNGKRPLMEEKWWTTGRGRHSVVKPTVPPLASKFSCTLSRLSSSTSAMYCATFFTTLWTVGRHQNTPWNNTNCLHTGSVNCTLTQPHAPNVTQTFTHQKLCMILLRYFPGMAILNVVSLEAHQSRAVSTEGESIMPKRIIKGHLTYQFVIWLFIKTFYFTFSNKQKTNHNWIKRCNFK